MARRRFSLERVARLAALAQRLQRGIEQGLEGVRLRGWATRTDSHLDLHLTHEAVCDAEFASRSPHEVLALLQLAMLLGGSSSSRRAASTRATRSTPMDEGDFDGTGQAFADSFQELRRVAAVHRGALPRARRSPRPGRPKN